MKKHRAFILVLALLLAPSALSGCGENQGVSAASPTPASAQKSAAINVKDMQNREVSLSAPATKIVALTPADCEILYALGAGGTVVGRGQYCDYPEAVKKIPAVQSGSDTNVEQIIALGPQVVIMSKLAQTDEQIAALEKAGIKVVVTTAKDIAGTYTSIRLIGAVVGKNNEAEKLVSDMKAAFAELSSKVKENSGKKIYLEVASLKNGLWAAGKGTFMDEIATMLGLKNIFSDISSWSKVSQEQVIERNPDYIVTFEMTYTDGQDPVKEIMSRKGWEDITAIKNKAVLSSTSNELMRPGPRLVDGAKMLYNFAYGK